MSTATKEAPQIFQREYYQRLHDIEENHWWAKGMRDAMDALLEKPLGDAAKLRVLDIGCGTGYLMNYMQDNYSIDREVVGLDVSEHALEFCRQRGHDKLILGSATDVPIPANSFDMIICIDTIQHLAGAGADMEALEGFARMLHRGGLLYLRTNSKLGRLELKGVDANQYRRYDVETVTKMLEKVGFHVERASYLNMLPSMFGALKEKFTAARKHEHHHHTDAIGPGLKIEPYKPGLGWLNALMHTELKIEAELIRAGISLPFGHSCGFVARKC